jgi:hypothetical protein
VQTGERSREIEGLGTVGNPRMTPHDRPKPPQTMAPLDVEPVEQGPHADDSHLWMSPERIAAIRRAEAVDAEDAERLSYAERQRAIDDARHRAGIARLARVQQEARERRDQEDASR